MKVKEEKLFNYFYKITNLINGKFYYGIRSSDKLHSDKYMGSGQHIKQAIEKYGKENFKKEIINHYPTRFEASEHERMVVDLETINDIMCYNAKTGGENGYIYQFTEADRKKVSDGLKGKKKPEEYSKKLSIRTRKKMEEDPAFRNQLGNLARGGNLITDDTRIKMRENRKNQIITPESRIKAIETRRNNGKPWHTEEERKERSKNNWLKKLKENAGPDGKIDYKPGNAVQCIINGIHFKSIADANQHFKITTTNHRIHSKLEKYKDWKLFIPDEEIEL